MGKFDYRFIVGAIKKPKILYPQNDSGADKPEIIVSEFEAEPYFQGKHTATDWEIATDPDLTNIVLSSYNDEANLYRFALNGLVNTPEMAGAYYSSETGTIYTGDGNYVPPIYYVRVRFKSGNFTSDWSDLVEFTPAWGYIEPPQLKYKAAAGKVKFTVDHVFVADGSLPQFKLEIASDPKFENLVQTILWYGSDSFEKDVNLPPNCKFYARVTYTKIDSEGNQVQFPYSNAVIVDTSQSQLVIPLPDEAYELETLKFVVYNINDLPFDPKTQELFGYVSGGELTINGFEVIWKLPSIPQDNTKHFITLWINDKIYGQSSHKVTKWINVRKVDFDSDDAVIVSDFSSVQSYNDQWDLTT